MPNNARRALRFIAGVFAVAAVLAVGNAATASLDAAAAAILGVFTYIAFSFAALVSISYDGRRKFKALRAKRDATAGTRGLSLSSRAVTGISRLLPAEVRDEYCEEWAAWMLDLRADGTPRLRRWIELLTIVLIAAPRLAIALRAGRRRAVDR